MRIFGGLSKPQPGTVYLSVLFVYLFSYDFLKKGKYTYTDKIRRYAISQKAHRIMGMYTVPHFFLINEMIIISDYTTFNILFQKYSFLLSLHVILEILPLSVYFIIMLLHTLSMRHLVSLEQA